MKIPEHMLTEPSANSPHYPITNPSQANQHGQLQAVEISGHLQICVYSNNQHCHHNNS
jgi:hypothetical protein